MGAFNSFGRKKVIMPPSAIIIDDLPIAQKSKVLFPGDRVIYRNRRNRMYIVTNVQGNDYYTCRKLELRQTALHIRYIETNTFHILHISDLKRCPRNFH